MKYALEMRQPIVTGMTRVLGPSKTDDEEFKALTEMLCQRDFMQELIHDGADETLKRGCRDNYASARDSALALGLDVSYLPKRISFPQQEWALAQ